MPLLKNGTVTADPWHDGTAGLIVTLEQWRAQRDTLLARNVPLGLRLAPSDDVETVGDDARRFALIAIDFPAFTDGRPYSSARLLRERYGYDGELRATGQVLRDQLSFMQRCGFDAFEIANPNAAQDFAAAVGEISVVYQPAGDREPTIAASAHRAA
ncbi:MAG: DUF934 domain-containing protein [Proteobacteria bacterium]|nr:DUF934 domain-containing protein [Pseudomonadota bacterium]MDA1058244.1 DUF934 domain-containing protein [Pseudomonadota bacterium]